MSIAFPLFLITPITTSIADDLSVFGSINVGGDVVSNRNISGQQISAIESLGLYPYLLLPAHPIVLNNPLF